MKQFPPPTTNSCGIAVTNDYGAHYDEATLSIESQGEEKVSVLMTSNHLSSSISSAVDGCPLTATLGERFLWQRRQSADEEEEKRVRSERFGIETALESLCLPNARSFGSLGRMEEEETG